MGPEAEFCWRASAVTPQITQDWRTLGSLPGPTILLPLDSISFKTPLEPAASTPARNSCFLVCKWRE